MIIENVVPTINKFGTGGVAWSSGSLSFSSIQIDDPLSSGIASKVAVSGLQLSIDGGITKTALPSSAAYDEVAGTLAFTIPDLGTTGTKSIVLYATDRAGNTAQASVNAKIDNDIPTFTLGTIALAKMGGSSYEIAVQVSDISELPGIIGSAQSGVAGSDGWKYSIDGGDQVAMSVSYSGSTFTKSLPLNIAITEGSHTLTLSCVDSVGNTSVASTTSFVVDKTAPTIVFPSKAGVAEANAAWSSSLVASCSASDVSGISGFTYALDKWDGAGWVSSGDGSVPVGGISISSDGVYKLILTAIDNALNVSTSTMYLRIDRTAPAISPPSGVGSSSTISASASDASSGVYESSWLWSLDEVGWLPGKTATITDGKNTTVWFKVTDMAGNTAKTSGVVTVDTMGPVVSYSTNAFAKGGSLALTGIASYDGGDLGTGTKRVEYRIDGGSVTTLVSSFSIGFDWSLAVSALAEGDHELGLRGIDNAGNDGPWTIQAFSVDMTEPELSASSVVLVQGGKNLTDESYATTASVSVTVTASDSYKNDTELKPGVIASYAWQTHKLPGGASLGTATTSAVSTFDATGLSSGLSYLTVWAVDAAGNVTNITRTIMVDDSAPGIPVITGLTHRRAKSLEDASALRDATFGLDASGSGGSGIASFAWRLEKGTAVADSGMIKAETGATVSLIGLADNGENEYYTLYVASVGGNDRAGIETSYRFRIDSTPPAGLRLEASPQADSDSWYAAASATVSWNIPADMTGVERYYYAIGLTEESVSHDAGSGYTGWASTSVRTIAVDLRSALGALDSGTVYVCVVASDWSGNHEADVISVKADLSAPALTPIGTDGNGKPVLLSIHETVDSVASSRVIGWGTLSDTGSGLSSVTVTATAFSGNAAPDRTMKLAIVEGQSQPSGVTLEGLSDGAVYAVRALVADAAGNTTEARSVVAIGGAAMPAQIVTPYSRDYGGLVVEGSLVTEADGTFIEYRNLNLRAPAALSISSIHIDVNGVESLSPATTIALTDDITASIDGVAMAQSADSVGHAYELTVDGMRFRAKSIVFSATTGLSLGDAAYFRSYDVADGLGTVTLSEAVALGYVGLGFPPDMSAAGSASYAVPDFVALVSDDSGVIARGYGMSGGDSLALASGSERLLGAAGPYFDQAFFADTGYPLANADGSTGIRLQSAKLSPGGIDAEGALVAGGVSLGMGGSSYSIVNAEVRGRLLVINEATLALPATYEPSVVTVRNFVIDGLGGTVAQGRYFSVDAVSVTGPNGEVVELASFNLGSDGTLFASGLMTYAAPGSSPVSITGFQLGSSGLDWAAGANLEGYSGTVHGFSVSSSKARVVSGGIVLDTASITIDGAPRTINALGLRTDRTPGAIDYVWKTGTGSETFSAKRTYEADFELSSLTVSVGGVYAKASVPVPAAFIDAADGKLVFDGTRLYADSTIAASLSGTRVLLGGRSALATGVSFDGARVRVTALTLDTPAGMTPETLELGGGTFTPTGIDTAPGFDGDISYAFGTWNVLFERVVLDEGGLGGDAFVVLPGALGGYVIEFPDFRITGNDTIASGIATAEAAAQIHGWEILLGSANLAPVNGEYLLSSPSASLSMDWMGGPTLSFGAIAIAGNGVMASCATGTLEKAFTAANGYAIVARSYTVGADYIELGGSLRPSWWAASRAVEFSTAGMRLHADGSVTSATEAPAVTYEFAGWTVSATGVSFGYDAISARTNTVNYFAESIPFGEMSYTSDGHLLAGAVFTEKKEFDLFGSKFGAIESKFDDDGVVVKAFVTLPEQLGGYGIYFDKVTLYQDGSFSVEDSVERFAFEVGGFSFVFEDLWLASSGIKVGSATITLPEALENKTVRLSGLTVTKDGEFELAGSSIDPFQMWGMWFGLENLSIVGGVVSFEGFIGLPETLPAGLAGRKVAINEFKVSTAGVVMAFDIRLDGEYTIPFLDSWALGVTDFGAVLDPSSAYPWLVIKQAKLIFPAGYPVSNASVANIKYNPVEGKFYFDDITTTMNNCSLSKWGMTFTLSTLQILATQGEVTGIGFGGSVTLPVDEMPEFLSGKTVAISMFQINRDGTLGDVSIATSGLSGKLFDALRLQDGNLALVKDGESLVASLGGSLVFTDAAPSGFSGRRLVIGDAATPNVPGFVYDLSRLKILKLDAGTPAGEGFDPVVLGVQMRNVGASISWNADTQVGTIGAWGGIVLPSTLPEGLKGQVAGVDSFKITTEGEILEFKASFDSAPGMAFDAIGNVQFMDVNLKAQKAGEVVAFDAGITVILPEDDFPEGIGGTSCRAAMSFSTAAGLETIDARIVLNPELSILDAMTLKNGIITLAKVAGQSSLTIGLGGTFLLPESFPEGLAGLPITGAISFDTAGTLSTLDIDASGINVDLFDGACGIEGGSISVTKGTSEYEMIFSVAGALRLKAEALPAGVKAATFEIRPLTVSTTRGLIAFSAAMNAGAAAVEFPLVSGITGGIKTLSLSMDELTLSAYAILPSSYPKGLATMRIDLSTLRMGWDWEIRQLEGGIGSASIELAGFKGTISKLYITQTGAGLESCVITLPANFGSMGGKSIGINNATFNKDTGAFNGEILIPTLESEFAGFKVTLAGPSLDFANKKIGFTAATIRTPDFTGSVSLTLNGVTLSPSGFSVSGGDFKIPDFTIAGGLGFTNMKVGFAIYDPPVDGQYFSILGGGSLTVPGAGTFTALVSFTNKSSIYPIGLKRAYFEYYVSGIGLPLGTSGLSINGIRGGLAFGPATELPAAVRGMFGNGARLQLGLRFNDTATFGRTVSADVDVWVDINDWDWAFQGDVTVLKGTFNLNANIVAALTSKGFYAGMNVTLVFVNGRIEMWVYSIDGVTKFAGSGQVQFGIAQGSIYTGKVWTPWKTYDVLVPPSTYWLPGLNAEFGDFTNGKRGFKGWVEVPLFGQLGVFVAGPGSISFNVSGLTLAKPDWAAPMASVAASVRKARGLSSSIAARDVRTSDTSSRDTYLFSVPSRDGPVETQSSTGAALRSASVRASEAGTGSVESSAYERIVFVLGFVEGDPDVVVSLLDGDEKILREYRPGDDDVETQYVENALLFAIVNPPAGQWRVDVSGLEEGLYTLEALKKESVPEISVVEPARSGIKAQDSFTVSGSAGASTGMVKVFVMPESKESGQQVATAAVGADGKFSVVVPTGDMTDGEYGVYVSYELEADKVEPRGYAAGTIIVDRSAKNLVAPGPFTASETGAGTIGFRWEDQNGIRAKGYYLLRDNATTKVSDRLYVGPIRSMSMAGFDSGDDITFSLVAIDASNNESPASESVRVVIGGVKPVRNAPRVTVARVYGTAAIGSTVSGTIAVAIDSYASVDDASGLLDAAPVGLYGASEDDPARKLAVGLPSGTKALAAGVELPWIVSLPDNLAPGRYELPCAVKNMGNMELSSDFTIVIDAVYPAPRADFSEPKAWNNTDAVEITVTGDAFIPGTRLFIDTTELAITSLKYGTMVATVPSGIASGDRNLIVRGPGGAQSAIAVSVTRPDWAGTLYSEYVEAVAGGQASFTMSITGTNGFAGFVSFDAASLPDGWSASLPSIPAGGEGLLTLTVSGGAAVGDYESLIDGTGGKRFALAVKVVSAPPAPTLSSLSSARGYTGESIRAYGYGLGTGGSLYLGESLCPVSVWSDGEVSFTVPDDAVSGNIVAQSGELSSNGIAFTVRERGFSIRPTADRIELEPGESGTVSVAVTGFADSIELSRELDASGAVSAALSESRVVPNDTIKVTIVASEGAASGSYQVNVTGSSRGFSSSGAITVVIGDAFALATDALPAGMTDTAYKASLAVENADGEASFSLTSGKLPAGLSLSTKGAITGRPIEPGSSAVRIKATDGRGRSDERSYTIIIEESAWAMTGRDGGRSRFAASDSPASGKKRWVSAKLGAIERIISGSGKLWVLGNGKITALDGSGSIAYVIETEASWAAYAGGRLYVVDAGGNLTAYDPATGLLLWTRPGIAGASTNGSLIAARGSDGSGLLFDAWDGILKDDHASVPTDLDSALWSNGLCYGIDGRYLKAAGGSPSYDAITPIVASAADSDGFVILTGEGELIALNAGLAETARLRLSLTGTATLALSDEAVYLSDGSGTRELTRAALTLSWSADSGGELAVARQKVFALGTQGLVAINRYRASTIWGDSGVSSSLALSGDRLYAADPDGRVSCYDAEDNIMAPVTAIVSTPPAPDGELGWFVSPTTVSVNATDAETFAERVFKRVNDGAYVAYEGPAILAEGTTSIAAYAIDDWGYQGEETSRSFKVDLGRPESSVTVTGAIGPNGWYLGNATVTLDATDTVSGVARIEVYGRGLYEAPIVLALNGAHELRWRAVDIAGNAQQWQAATILVDHAAPIVSASQRGEAGISLVTITATDEGSGIERIEYEADGGPTSTYTMPLSFTAAGIHSIRYRAIDTAGNASAWAVTETWTRPWRPASGYVAFASGADGAGIDIYRPTHPGMPLYSDGSRGFVPRAAELPRYARGGDAPLVRSTDRGVSGETMLEFWAKRDIVVYAFVNASDTVPGWHLVESGLDLDGMAPRDAKHGTSSFPGGASIYMKRYAADSRVSIPGEAGVTGAPFVVAVPQVHYEANITEPSERDDYAPLETLQLSVSIDIDRGRDDDRGNGNGHGWGDDSREGELPLRTEWSIYEGDAWTVLPGDGYTLPWTDTIASVKLRVRLYEADGYLAATDEATAKIVNRAEFHMRSPRAGSSIRVDSKVDLSYEARDAEGHRLEVDAWYESRDGLSWTEAPVIRDSWWMTPETTGPVYLKAVWTVAEGRTRESITEYMLTKRSGR